MPFCRAQECIRRGQCVARTLFHTVDAFRFILLGHRIKSNHWAEIAAPQPVINVYQPSRKHSLWFRCSIFDNLQHLRGRIPILAPLYLVAFLVLAHSDRSPEVTHSAQIYPMEKRLKKHWQKSRQSWLLILTYGYISAFSMKTNEREDVISACLGSFPAAEELLPVGGAYHVFPFCWTVHTSDSFGGRSWACFTPPKDFYPTYAPIDASNTRFNVKTGLIPENFDFKFMSYQQYASLFVYWRFAKWICKWREHPILFCTGGITAMRLLSWALVWDAVLTSTQSRLVSKSPRGSRRLKESRFF